jgi:endoglucanase
VNRRQFIKTAGTAALATAIPTLPLAAASAIPTATRLPRWHGFNLTEKFVARQDGNPPFADSDFALLAEWGFDFVRLPMSYLCWASQDEPLKLREAELKHLDQVAEFGRKHGVHVNFNLHRAPGYCVNPPKEPLDLWKDEPALDNCAFHWAHLAKRFKGIPNNSVSFDLLNEPPSIPEETYTRVVKHLVQAIRAEDPQRLVIADGLRWGRDPVHSLVDLGIGQSTRGYDPMQISHYQANWVNGADKWAEPTWPLKLGDKITDKQTLRKDRILPWKQLEQKGVGIHVGEWGAHNRTPHKVALAWMRDCLELWKEAGWGWSLWNLRGSFGVLDSRRADVEYEDLRGHKLDREMLKVLQAGCAV